MKILTIQSQYIQYYSAQYYTLLFDFDVNVGQNKMRIREISKLFSVTT